MDDAKVRFADERMERIYAAVIARAGVHDAWMRSRSRAGCLVAARAAFVLLCRSGSSCRTYSYPAIARALHQCHATAVRTMNVLRSNHAWPLRERVAAIAADARRDCKGLFP